MPKTTFALFDSWGIAFSISWGRLEDNIDADAGETKIAAFGGNSSGVRPDETLDIKTDMIFIFNATYLGDVA